MTIGSRQFPKIVQFAEDAWDACRLLNEPLWYIVVGTKWAMLIYPGGRLERHELKPLPPLEEEDMPAVTEEGIGE